jgi:hypothetical protein
LVRLDTVHVVDVAFAVVHVETAPVVAVDAVYALIWYPVIVEPLFAVESVQVAASWPEPAVAVGTPGVDGTLYTVVLALAALSVDSPALFVALAFT